MTDAQRLNADLAALPRTLAAPLQIALQDIAAAAVAEARARLPPGPLADSLVVELTDGAVVIATGDPAAVAVEYGTRAQAARPFLRPAAEAAAATGRAALAAAVSEAVHDALERS